MFISIIALSLHFVLGVSRRGGGRSLFTKYNERPQLGQVLKVEKDKATIKWFDGTWSSKWKVYNYRDGRKTAAWIETLPVTKIISGKIELTKSGLIAKDKLKEGQTERIV